MMYFSPVKLDRNLQCEDSEIGIMVESFRPLGSHQGLDKFCLISSLLDIIPQQRSKEKTRYAVTKEGLTIKIYTQRL